MEMSPTSAVGGNHDLWSARWGFIQVLFLTPAHPEC